MALHIVEEADRCLNCKKPLCQKGCPVGTSIPLVIQLFRERQIDEAGAVLFQNNPMSAVCSLVCNHGAQCEGHCVRGRKGTPIHFSASSDEVEYAQLDGAELLTGKAIQYITDRGPVFKTAIFDENDKVVGYEDELERRLMNRSVDLACTLRPMILPTMRSISMMSEDLYAFVPANHRLAGRPTVSFDDLDGESFLVLTEVGFWMDTLRRNMPHAHIVEQTDRSVFEQLVATTELVSFVTNVTRESRSALGRVAVPIVDADAHATFYLTTLIDAPQRVQDIYQWVSAQQKE